MKKAILRLTDNMRSLREVRDVTGIHFGKELLKVPATLLSEVTREKSGKMSKLKAFEYQELAKVGLSDSAGQAKRAHDCHINTFKRHVNVMCSQVMPTILRGCLDGALEFFNEGDTNGEPFFDAFVSDPIPKAIQVWERYNRWCVEISRGGGGERISELQLIELDTDAVDLFRQIRRAFPWKHGATDKEKAWNILKGHNLLQHMTDSVRMYGRVQVCHTLMTVT
jgi:hypothetical protein